MSNANRNNLKKLRNSNKMTKAPKKHPILKEFFRSLIISLLVTGILEAIQKLVHLINS